MTRHAATGRIVVIPIRRVADGASRDDRAARPAAGDDGRRLRPARRRPRSCSAPLVGSTHISLRRAFDRTIPFADNVDAQIFFIARLPRTLAGALVGSHARLRRRRLPGPASESARHAVHARRLGRRRAWRHARDHVQLVVRMGRASPPRRRPASSARLRPSVSSTCWPAHAIADCRPTCCCSRA